MGEVSHRQGSASSRPYEQLITDQSSLLPVLSLPKCWKPTMSQLQPAWPGERGSPSIRSTPLCLFRSHLRPPPSVMAEHSCSRCSGRSHCLQLIALVSTTSTHECVCGHCPIPVTRITTTVSLPSMTRRARLGVSLPTLEQVSRWRD